MKHFVECPICHHRIELVFTNRRFGDARLKRHLQRGRECAGYRLSRLVAAAQVALRQAEIP